MADKNQRVKFGGHDPDRPTSYNKGSTGVKSIWDEFGNFIIDANRGAANASSAVSDFLTSSQTKPLGNTLFGRGPGEVPDYVPDESSRRASVMARLNRKTPGYGRQEQTGLVDQFAQYLTQAENFVPGESDWGALENSLRGRASEHDAKLAAMYNQLRGAIQADAPQTAANYDQGISAIDESAQQATQAITQGYDAARQAQTSSLAALGIEDAAAGLVSDGGGVDFAAQNQGQATEQVANTNQTNEDALTKNKAAALTYNTNMGNVAQLEGTESRGQLQNSLTDALSQMAFAQSQEAKQRQATIYEVAMGLKQKAEAGEEISPEEQLAVQKSIADQQQQAYENATQQTQMRDRNYLALMKLFEDPQRAAEAYSQSQSGGFFG